MRDLHQCSVLHVDQVDVADQCLARLIGAFVVRILTLHKGNVFENGELKFVTYTGGNGTIITGFQVNFEEQANECRAYAFAVISSLTSVPASQATPMPTP